MNSDLKKLKDSIDGLIVLLYLKLDLDDISARKETINIFLDRLNKMILDNISFECKQEILQSLNNKVREINYGR